MTAEAIEPPTPTPQTEAEQKLPPEDAITESRIGKALIDLVNNALTKELSPTEIQDLSGKISTNDRPNTTLALLNIITALSDKPFSIEALEELLVERQREFESRYLREDGRVKTTELIEELIDPYEETYKNTFYDALATAIKKHEIPALREAQRLGAFIVLNYGQEEDGKM